MNFTIIKTERLHLRLIAPETYRYLFDSPEPVDLVRFFGSTARYELEKQRYQKGITTFNKSFANFQILDANNDAVIGACGYHTWYTEHRRAEIGYQLYDELARNKGFMAEAMAAVIRYGFNEMGLNRIEAFVGPENIPSLKLMHRFGFSEEGRLRQHYVKDGHVEDSIVFSLLKDEFVAAKANTEAYVSPLG
jgi:[ribosomal protein S5]-alanine N-acetyltransferase